MDEAKCKGLGLKEDITKFFIMISSFRAQTLALRYMNLTCIRNLTLEFNMDWVPPGHTSICGRVHLYYRINIAIIILFIEKPVS